MTPGIIAPRARSGHDLSGPFAAGSGGVHQVRAGLGQHLVAVLGQHEPRGDRGVRRHGYAAR